MLFTYRTEDTIAAIATPPGEGGVGMVRISGEKAVEIADRIFSGSVKDYATHTAHYGHVVNLGGNRVDSALCLVMLGKRSYTGQDTVEIHCHGGGLITQKVLETVLEAGARAAEAGEFTFRAFLNEKIDLAQAESVQELICAKNERALDAAGSHLQGALSEKIKEFQFELTEIAAILEAWVDFPEEGLEFASFEEILSRLQAVQNKMQGLLNTFHDGKIVSDGIALCLAGCPNVGKSSLMNALLGKERAIISNTPGTTRDVLEDNLQLNQLNIRLIDTAGIHDAEEEIEQEGIRRSKQAMEEADLILLVLDASREVGLYDRKLLDSTPPEKTIIIWNKTDLGNAEPPALPFPHIVHTSAKLRKGLDELRQTIDKVIWKDGPPSREEVVITKLRHKEALAKAVQACTETAEGLRNGVSAEFVTYDMRQCLIELGKIIGTDVTEDILSSIFSKFCVGK